MAQVLKDESRISILNAAKEEFLEKGYKNASMRSIAKKANMTVGNLYRYYKNKEDINLSIVGPTYREISAALKELINDSLLMEPRVYDVKPEMNKLMERLDTFSRKLINIYSKKQTEFNILILHSRINEEIIKYFSDLISSIISVNFVMQGINYERDVLANAYAESLYGGIQYIFKECKDSKILDKVLKEYLHSFIFMLNNDIGKLSLIHI